MLFCLQKHISRNLISELKFIWNKMMAIFQPPTYDYDYVRFFTNLCFAECRLHMLFAFE